MSARMRGADSAAFALMHLSTPNPAIGVHTSVDVAVEVPGRLARDVNVVTAAKPAERLTYGAVADVSVHVGAVSTRSFPVRRVGHGITSTALSRARAGRGHLLRYPQIFGPRDNQETRSLLEVAIPFGGRQGLSALDARRRPRRKRARRKAEGRRSWAGRLDVLSCLAHVLSPSIQQVYVVRQLASTHPRVWAC